MDDSDKEAFIDGFQEAMSQANEQTKRICTVIRQEASRSENNFSIEAMSSIAFVCASQSDTADFSKVTVKDLDEFYAEPLNQCIPLVYSMAWLRDRARSTKTRGQLIDELDKYRDAFKVKSKESPQ
jgi:hypothetical protein